MDLHLSANGIELDGYVREYIRATVVFSTWHHARSARIEIDLQRCSLPRQGPGVACQLRVQPEGRLPVTVSASGAELWEVVQGAADRLESALALSGLSAYEALDVRQVA